MLARTLEELATHGPTGLSVERIAAAAEVNKTSVYRRWPTREALVVAALDRVRADLSAQLPDTGSLRGDLRALGEAVAAFLAQPAGRALAAAAFSTDLPPTVGALARRQLEVPARDAAVDLVRRALDRGEWRAGAPADVVLAMLVGAVLHRVVLERRRATPAWVRGVADLLARGVAPEALGA